jgi:hypothetical protein
MTFSYPTSSSDNHSNVTVNEGKFFRLFFCFLVLNSNVIFVPFIWNRIFVFNYRQYLFDYPSNSDFNDSDINLPLTAMCRRIMVDMVIVCWHITGRLFMRHIHLSGKKPPEAPTWLTRKSTMRLWPYCGASGNLRSQVAVTSKGQSMLCVAI